MIAWKGIIIAAIMSAKNIFENTIIGEDRLKPDTGNKYLFNVKAEDESIKTYTVTVFRAKNPEEEITKSIDSPITTKLKDLKITNGKLNQKFDPNVYSYTYKKKDGFKIEYELMEESSFVNVYEEDNNIVGIIMAEKQNSKPLPIAKERTTYFINDIVVDKNYRRKKIAKKLYDLLLEQAKKEKVNSIELNVWAFNEDAIKFYESLGMKVKNMKFENIIN